MDVLIGTDFLNNIQEDITISYKEDDVLSQASDSEMLIAEGFWDDLNFTANTTTSGKDATNLMNLPNKELPSSKRFISNSEINESTPKSLSTNICWADLNLSRPLLKALIELGYSSPTPIQMKTIPIAIEGRDILGTAQTGSGKTAAFLLPILERLLRSPNVRLRSQVLGANYINPSASKALILLPTRELSLQCFQSLEKLSVYTKITKSLITGGFTLKTQETELRKQPDIVVATPGRILDLLMNSQSIHLDLLEIVVFDEADRLMELGFKEDCTEIISLCSQERQTMLFSATLTNKTAELAKFSLENPIKITIDCSHKVTGTLEQEFVQVEEESEKEMALLHLCTNLYKKNVIIFFQTKKSVHKLALIFKLLGMTYSELYGDLTQSQRLESLESFRNGDVCFLLATELASRGLDIKGVKTVINFDLPLEASRYIHRVGRTARMGSKGKAVTLFTASQYKTARKMAKDVSLKSNPHLDITGFLKRKIPSHKLLEWGKKISSLEENIKKLLQQEKVQKELDKAEMEINKAQNIQKYGDDIMARPARKWHVSQKQKIEMTALSSSEFGTKTTSLSQSKGSNDKFNKNIKAISMPSKLHKANKVITKASSALKTKRKGAILPVKNEPLNRKTQSEKGSLNTANIRTRRLSKNSFKSKKRYKRR